MLNAHMFIKERIVALFFHATRKSTTAEYIQFETELSNLIHYIRELIQKRNRMISDVYKPDNDFSTILPSVDFDNAEYGFYLQTIYRWILHTRDASRGKGERTITYSMICALFEVYPEKALEIITRFVIGTDAFGNTNSSHCFGGWMDMKKLADYVHHVKSHPKTHPIIQHCIQLTNTQLYIDNSFSRHNMGISDVAQCIPRENSAYAWFFHELSNDWCMRHTPYYITSARTIEQKQLAIRKINSIYRKQVSKLSHQATPVKPERTLFEFVQEASRILDLDSGLALELNHEWNIMVKTHSPNKLWGVLPVLDISSSMNEDNSAPLFTAIGVTCFLLEKTTLEKRVITIDQTPSWIIIPDELPFVSTVKMLIEVASKHGGTNKNIYRTITLLANSFGISGSVMSDISLVIISDMKFQHFCDSSIRFPMDDYIRSCFLTLSVRQVEQRQFDGDVDDFPTIPPSANSDCKSKCPHIAYWNVGMGAVDLPCEFDKLGATVISGSTIHGVRFILPEWHYDCMQNPIDMLANTPFDSMCSVLSDISLSASTFDSVSGGVM